MIHLGKLIKGEVESLKVYLSKFQPTSIKVLDDRRQILLQKATALQNNNQISFANKKKEEEEENIKRRFKEDSLKVSKL